LLINREDSLAVEHDDAIDDGEVDIPPIRPVDERTDDIVNRCRVCT
jgi:hypothetical protein